MNQQARGYGPDLSEFNEEELAVLAQKGGSLPARDEVILQTKARADAQIVGLAQRQGLGAEDVLDAKQAAVFWIIEAVERYDIAGITKPRGCSFRSFLHCLLSSRFKDFVKQLRRLNRRGAGGAPQQRPPAGSPAAQKLPFPCGDWKVSDPATLAQQRETAARLQAELDALPKADRRLWDLLAAGQSLHVIGLELSVSWDRVKRRRRCLLAGLRLRLADVLPEDYSA